MLKATCELCGDVVVVDDLVNGVCAACIAYERHFAETVDERAEAYEQAIVLDRFGCYD